MEANASKVSLGSRVQDRARQARSAQPDPHALVTHMQTFAVWAVSTDVNNFVKRFKAMSLGKNSIWQQSCLT